MLNCCLPSYLYSVHIREFVVYFTCNILIDIY